MSLWSRARKVWHLGEVIAAIGAAGQAPPPPDLPVYLRQQYADHSKSQVEKLGRDIKRLTAAPRRPTTAVKLDRDSARRLRGKR
ncbi:hypothetical protein [Streptomyces avidinii]|uniref:Uncharacterized protein n=1 Tax=Streptomyces avidinii TaxID=1895 RepID=A0ABS4KW43_STRAV|nr:hypothetical protein [Streptomyces avidinii]MBP2034249.1 hypothetical protein [Streptomyces avidinii]GGZ35254.1 hypothetical protein GCM10010343_73160 [Streptomyces avidinii]